MDKNNLTPKAIVASLDEHIIGQADAKRKVAISLRNRYRRMALDENMQKEIIPKNILMIGPTGVGKTEIARRMATLVGAPFVKVEATKYTEVGYVGRDVESMIRDLTENGVRLIKNRMKNEVRTEAEKNATERLIKLLAPAMKKKEKQSSNPFEMLFNQTMQQEEEVEDVPDENVKLKRKDIRERLLAGQLEDETVKIKVEQELKGLGMFGMNGMQDNMQDMFSQMMPKKKVERTLPVSRAREILIDEEATKLIDEESVQDEAIQLVETMGIVFIDEIDKIAGSNQGADVSRQGVQRDILPIVEGSVVQTKYGAVNTEHILFIGAGAFHVSKPSDLIPELQGRFPIRVELEKLSVEDFIKILKEPKTSLLKQYESLMQTEHVTINFTDEAIEKLAQIAYDVNQETDNIGARRLHTILEKMLEDLSYEAPDMPHASVEITAQYVESKLGTIAKNKDLSEFIL
ncbi:ATP-dependent protease ATPase subunit HslU [Macrococcoides bohemicum]|uniref:ATP-dependent protease ATPase subunit HslU n=1 Tax=Macrococcoides bohemicum TaxID=1903056 RepID=A0A328A3F7_9STAP|nr:ATP-dependent protease ATPase subunit HslU [Macrococcus bohemicus]MBC9875140.1 ATP-dependent protease ATPase subunit HslU [Macrococcus bohemicus]QYA45825.1 ATP-dependent protease ATPase subunit HslU [Macrococcus bohemicus]RAK49009.1 HslU--HslV peptidase ATPase subunit [Macrococcus bohemicus]TDL36996.1 ATP-dependent protease ATPase subunit HslU [Macrococcus bohemicus]